jgi:predicted N-acyltransferase
MSLNKKETALLKGWLGQQTREQLVDLLLELCREDQVAAKNVMTKIYVEKADVNALLSDIKEEAKLMRHSYHDYEAYEDIPDFLGLMTKKKRFCL